VPVQLRARCLHRGDDRLLARDEVAADRRRQPAPGAPEGADRVEAERQRLGVADPGLAAQRRPHGVEVVAAQ
jgi:hypothetical protein